MTTVVTGILMVVVNCGDGDFYGGGDYGGDDDGRDWDLDGGGGDGAGGDLDGGVHCVLTDRALLCSSRWSALMSIRPTRPWRR